MKKIVKYRVPQVIERVYEVGVEADDDVSAIAAAVHKLKAASGIFEPHNGFICKGNDLSSITNAPGIPGYFALGGRRYDADGIEGK